LVLPLVLLLPKFAFCVFCVALVPVVLPLTAFGSATPGVEA